MSTVSCWENPEYCEMFLRAGGTISLSDWVALDTREQACFVEAGNVIKITDAVLIGKAVSDPQLVLAEIDGGDEIVSQALEFITDKIELDNMVENGNGHAHAG